MAPNDNIIYQTDSGKVFNLYKWRKLANVRDFITGNNKFPELRADVFRDFLFALMPIPINIFSIFVHLLIFELFLIAWDETNAI